MVTYIIERSSHGHLCGNVYADFIILRPHHHEPNRLIEIRRHSDHEVIQATAFHLAQRGIRNLEEAEVIDRVLGRMWTLENLVGEE